MTALLSALPLALATDYSDYSDYTDYGESTMDPATAGALIALMVGVYLIALAAAIVISGLVWAGAFQKAGHAKWKAYVPLYNTWIMVKMTGRPESHFWFLFIPWFNIYMMIVIMNDLSKSFGKDTGFTVGLIFVPVVFAAIISYGDAAYRGPSYLTAEQKAYAQQYYAQQQYNQQQFNQAQYAQNPYGSGPTQQP